MKRFSKKNKQKKVIISKNKKGGWNNQKYYYRNNHINPLLNDALAIQIGKFLINDELERYLLNDNTYYRPHMNNLHTEDEKIRKLKLQLIKDKFKTNDDYKWLGNQFYCILGNQNPFHNGGIGYATWDDGVAFFDYITNTVSRGSYTPNLQIPNQYNNPLDINFKQFLVLHGKFRNMLFERLKSGF